MERVPYVELHAHSAYSFLDGASTPLELARMAAKLGYEAFALTDHDGVWGSMEFAQACRALKPDLDLRPIVGAELTLALDADGETPGRHVHVTLLVESAAGYRNLCRLLTAAHAGTRDGPARAAGRPAVPLAVLTAHSEGLVCLSGCAGEGAVAAAWERGEGAAGAALARRLLESFGRERFRIELQRPYWRHDRARNRWLAALAERLGVPAVATGNVHAHRRGRSHLQDAFVSIRLGTTLEACEPRRRGNSSSALASPRAMAARFAEHPEAVAETLRLAERLRFDLRADLGYAYPGAENPDADRELAEVCRHLLAGRYAGSDLRAEAEAKLEAELATIRRRGLSGFFLLHRDLLELAREVAAEVRGPDSARAILAPGRGRGSSVSSIVCFLTGLSHIDPVKARLFSGRFLNDEAVGEDASMPDIDLDFPRDIREVLLRRIGERYGADRAALVAAFPTYRPRGAVRDLGKALALPPAEIDRVAKLVGFHESSGEIERDVVAAIGAERAAAPGWRHLLDLCPEAMGLPRHASQHPGGMVISTQPLIDVCPVVPAAMEGRRIIQWDKESCADAGFLKIDLLGLGMLSVVERCVEEVGRTRGEPLDLSRIDYADRGTYESIQAADTTGVFQIESRAQMQMLPRTHPEDLDDLTVQVALVRPGPIQGGAVHPYIERRTRRRREGGAYPIPYEHPLLEKALEDTLGTIVYQEQVLEVAIDLAGFSWSQAEGLRRAMSRKRSREALDEFHELFVAGAGKNEVPAAIAERVWEQIQGFSGFGFPKAHSAAFGLLAYQSAWLRNHFGPEFLAALLNEQPMGFYPPDALVHDARRRGIELAGPDVVRSLVRCHVESPRSGTAAGEEVRGGRRVRIGLGYVKGAREEEMEALVAERDRNGPYRGIADLASRAGVGRDGLERLAWAGALDDLLGGEAPGRREALWEAGTAPTAIRAAAGTQMALPLADGPAPDLQPLGPWGEAIADYRSTGLTTGTHPVGLMRGELPEELLTSADLARVEDGGAVEVGGMVVARQRPETAKGIVFVLLEDERGTVNLIVPPPVYERFRALVRAASLLRAKGRLERREGVTNVIVSAVAPLEVELGSRREAGSRSPGWEHPRELRARAVAELRAVAPPGHSWGRRGG